MKWPRENNDSEQDPTPKHPQKNGTGRSGTETQSTTSDDTTKKQGSSNVILITLASDSKDSNFNNPIKWTESLNKSEFNKDIIENSLRILGIGKAVRFEVSDINKIRPQPNSQPGWMGDNMQTTRIQ